MNDPFLEAVGVKTEQQAMKDSLRSALGGAAREQDLCKNRI
jgi:hypothetical protein